MARGSYAQHFPDDWMVTMLVSLMKFWLFFGFAAVKAALIVAEDPEIANAFRALFNPMNDV